MDSQYALSPEVQAIFAAAMASIGIIIVIVLVLYVLYIIAHWKIFTKAGEPGWATLIPGYNLYISFKIAWETKYFWTWLGCTVVYYILATSLRDATGTAAYIGVAASDLLSLASGILVIILCFRTSKAFGHGTGFGFGLLLLNTIFTLILGLGDSKYVGNPSAIEAEKPLQ